MHRSALELFRFLAPVLRPLLGELGLGPMLAAIQAPIIMMSQNRQDGKDRLRGEPDFEVDRRAASATHPCRLPRQIAPIATTTQAAMRCTVRRSLRNIRPISAANTTLVSRSAETGPIGLKDMATITMP